MTCRRRVTLVLGCVTALSVRQPVTSGYWPNQPPQDSPDRAQRKIASWVLEHTDRGQVAEVLVIFADAADLRGADAFREKREKGRFVRDALFAKAQQTQAPLVEWLRNRGLDYRSF